MEYENLKKLLENISNSNLSTVNIELPDGTKISATKPERQVENNCFQKLSGENIRHEVLLENESLEENGYIVKSPMVGTFYIKPSPTSHPYVEIGSVVKKGETLCIIEAMKLMNEIESDYSGTVKEIYIKDGEAVEYGKPLFRIV